MVFNTEEIFGMFFRYIKVLAKNFCGVEIIDCTVTVPAFFGYKERHAVIQALQLANLNLLGFVNENVAAAVNCVTENKVDLSYDPTTQYVIFYNVGASYTQATLVKYLNDIKVVSGKNVTTKYVEVMHLTII